MTNLEQFFQQPDQMRIYPGFCDIEAFDLYYAKRGSRLATSLKAETDPIIVSFIENYSLSLVETCQGWIATMKKQSEIDPEFYMDTYLIDMFEELFGQVKSLSNARQL